jgi:alcohol dehydrogenase class IV
MTIRSYRFPNIDRVVHGAGAVRKIERLLEELGSERALILTGNTLATQTPIIAAIVDQLGSRCVGVYSGLRQHAPKRDIDEATVIAERLQADALVGIGGSSVTDATKIVAVRRLGATKPQSAMPQILVPTTLSAGEYTPASGMTGDIPGVKTYVVDPRMAPFAVVLDPEITLHTPDLLWRSTGLKSIEHACEMLWSPKAHPLSTALSNEALRLLIAGLHTTLRVRDDLDARLQCQIAGWMSMSGVMNVQVYLSHTLGHQIGARWDVPHGYTSGITLPAVMRFMAASAPEPVAHIGAAFLDAQREHHSGDGAQALVNFVASLGLPTTLREVHASRDDFGAVAAATIIAGRATGFAGDITESDVVQLLEDMW